MKILFLLAISPNPRMTKRMRALKKENDIFLIYWRMQEQYLWGGSWQDIRYKEVFIRAQKGAPVKRIGKTFRFMLQALKEIRKENPECIYIQNLDMLSIACLYKKLWNKDIRLVYEIADLHSYIIQPPKSCIGKILQKILRRLESCLCRQIYMLINTSEKYYDVYYSKFVPREKLLVIPNVPDIKAFSNYEKKNSGEFTVGFIGGVQFKQELKLLIQASKEINVTVRIAGSEIGNEIDKICKKEDIYYHGPYNYDRDISELYSAIDCVFAVYDSDNYNVKIALPNKLYEAILCEIPILVAKGTYLSEVVEKLGIGVSIEHDDIEDYKRALSDLKTNILLREKISKQCRGIKTQYQLETYNLQLVERICKRENSRV